MLLFTRYSLNALHLNVLTHSDAAPLFASFLHIYRDYHTSVVVLYGPTYDHIAFLLLAALQRPALHHIIIAALHIQLNNNLLRISLQNDDLIFVLKCYVPDPLFNLYFAQPVLFLGRFRPRHRNQHGLKHVQDHISALRSNRLAKIL